MNNNNTPLVSVVVPVYNVLRYLDACVSGIVLQTYHNIQVVLVDDGSTDGSSELCDDWARRDSRVDVVHQSNAGVSAARNVGLSRVRGRYVMFVDGDDVLDPHGIGMLVSHAMAHRSQIVFFSNSVDFLIDGTLVPQRRNHMAPFAVTSSAAFLSKYAELSRNEYVCPPWNKLFDASFVAEVGARFPEDVHYGEDLVFNMALYAAAERVSLIDEPLYHYVARSTSAQSVFNPDWFANRARAYVLMRPIAQRWGDAALNECDNQTVLEIDRVINALYGSQSDIPAKRRTAYVRTIVNDAAIQACVSHITPIDRRRAIVSMLLKRRSVLLLCLYGWLVAMIKKVKGRG